MSIRLRLNQIYYIGAVIVCFVPLQWPVLVFVYWTLLLVLFKIYLTSRYRLIVLSRYLVSTKGRIP